MAHLLPASSLWWLCAAAAMAQQPAAKPQDPLALVAKAEKLCTTGDKEEGVLLLWQALELLAQPPEHPVRASAALTARSLLKSHDPLDADLRAAQLAVAKAQVELATAYRTRKWFDTAAQRLDVAERFDRDLVAKERGLLAAQRPKAKAEAGAAPAPAAAAAKGNPLFRRDALARSSGVWRESEDLLECAAHAATSGVHEWVLKGDHADGEMVVEFRSADGKGDENAGFVFGVGGDSSYLASASHFVAHQGLFTVALFQVGANEYKDLGNVSVAGKAGADGFHRFAVSVRGGVVRVQLDEAAPLEITVATPPRGQFGLSVGLGNRDSPTVVFRGLRVGPLPADAPSDEDLRAEAAAAVQSAVLAAVDRAKALTERKQPEAAAAELREAVLAARELPAGLLRDNLVQSIDGMLAGVDPLTAKRRKSGQDAAKAFVAVADRYAAAGQARLAARVVDLAAGFDPEGTAARQFAAQQAVAAWNVRIATERASELAPPANDGAVLREWFAGGRRLDSRLPEWEVAGPVARVVDLQPETFAAWMPKAGVPLANKAAVHVRLPQVGVASGFCFDVAGPHEYAAVFLVRRAKGLSLDVWRYGNGQWKKLVSKPVEVDAWKLDGWFEVALEAGASGVTVRGGGASLELERKLLPPATGRIGLWTNNEGKQPATVEFRAFRILP